MNSTLCPMADVAEQFSLSENSRQQGNGRVGGKYDQSPFQGPGSPGGRTVDDKGAVRELEPSFAAGFRPRLTILTIRYGIFGKGQGSLTKC